MAVLAGRVAVVTGASVGIGAGLAAMLAAEGAKVVLAARRGDNVKLGPQILLRTMRNPMEG
jgi:NADP-dependent 3-hydroxy acid dehydrogenase YdfG